MAIHANYTPPVMTHLAALPPWVQEQREKEGIANDPRRLELLGDAIIQEIRKIEGGYLVLTDSLQMRVDVSYLPHPEYLAGPAKFELFFHRPVPRTF